MCRTALKPSLRSFFPQILSLIYHCIKNRLSGFSVWSKWEDSITLKSARSNNEDLDLWKEALYKQLKELRKHSGVEPFNIEYSNVSVYLGLDYVIDAYNENQVIKYLNYW